MGDGQTMTFNLYEKEWSRELELVVEGLCRVDLFEAHLSKRISSKLFIGHLWLTLAFFSGKDHLSGS